jgi:hypothetical protein
MERYTEEQLKNSCISLKRGEIWHRWDMLRALLNLQGEWEFGDEGDGKLAAYRKGAEHPLYKFHRVSCEWRLA